MKRQLLITSGKGPQECNLAVQNTLLKIKHEAMRASLTVEIISAEKDNGTYCSIILSIEGRKVVEFTQRWIGTIQWICKSRFRHNHKRKNWFIAVQTLENQTQIQLDESKIQFETMRSSGAGGQHVNKVSSAVRATYEPLNLSVQAMDTRSQLQNKQIAIQHLQEKISSLNQQSKANISHHNWINQAQIVRGNPIRIFEGIKFVEKQKKPAQ